MDIAQLRAELTADPTKDQWLLARQVGLDLVVAFGVHPELLSEEEHAELGSQVIKTLRKFKVLPGLESLVDAARVALTGVPNIDAAFMSKDGDNFMVIVLVRDHELADWETIVGIEDALSKRFGCVGVTVRAHQGRGAAGYEHLVRVL